MTCTKSYTNSFLCSDKISQDSLKLTKNPHELPNDCLVNVVRYTMTEVCESSFDIWIKTTRMIGVKHVLIFLKSLSHRVLVLDGTRTLNLLYLAKLLSYFAYEHR